MIQLSIDPLVLIQIKASNVRNTDDIRNRDDIQLKKCEGCQLQTELQERLTTGLNRRGWGVEVCLHDHWWCSPDHTHPVLWF